MTVKSTNVLSGWFAILYFLFIIVQCGDTLEDTVDNKDEYRKIPPYPQNSGILPSDQNSIDTVLKGFYNRLKYNPGLMKRRMYVGSKPPIYMFRDVQKRSADFNIGIAQSVCPGQSKWELLYKAYDLFDSEVTVFQPDSHNSDEFQWFYTLTCGLKTMRSIHPKCKNCCYGIDNRRYYSVCLPKKSYVMALVRKNTAYVFDWDWIQIDTSCSCAISQRRQSGMLK